jgi:DNA-directed RNA polymerase subunit RPC12/RpoP
LDEGDQVMKKWTRFLFVLMILSGFLLGCTENLKDTKDTMIKCPKCGAFFSTKEGAEEFKRMQAYPDR